MQTFMAYPNFYASLLCLDYRRHNKQRSEAKLALDVLLNRPLKNGKLGGESRWRNHTVIRMWRGYEQALKLYYNICIELWIIKGYNNNMQFEQYTDNIVLPHWSGNAEFHISHKSNLLRKDPKFYSQYNWGVPDNLPYVWPSGREGRG